MVQDAGYDEVNINVGCPSVKAAGKGCFGAALMKDPERVREIVASIRRRAPELRVSIKTRTGVDTMDSMAFLRHFVATVASAGCQRMIIHARKAWLNGINPTQNRRIPPLEYEKVYQLAQEFPDIAFTLNGGVSSLEEVRTFLESRWEPSPSLVNTTSSTRPRVHVASPLQSDAGCSPFHSKSCSSHVPESPHATCVCKDDDNEKIVDPSRTWDADLLPLGDDIAEPPPEKSRRQHVKQPSFPRKRQAVRYAEKLAEAEVLIKALEVPTQWHTLGRCAVLPDATTPRMSTVEGVMIGRAAMRHPCAFSCVDSQFYGTSDPFTAATPRSIVQSYMTYLDEQAPDPSPQKSVFPLVKPLLGLLAGLPGHRAFRFRLDTAVREHTCTLAPSSLVQLVLDTIDSDFPGALDTPTGAQLTPSSLLL